MLSAFDLTPLIGTCTADTTDHVHLLRVTAEWFCKSETCEGHDAPVDDGELEFDYGLEHPDACPIPPCCCKWPKGPTQIDPNCEGGLHDACLNRDRCWTEQELSSWGLETFDFPKATAVYRIQAWGSTDYWGEHDGGIEFEPIAEAVTAA